MASMPIVTTMAGTPSGIVGPCVAAARPNCHSANVATLIAIANPTRNLRRGWLMCALRRSGSANVQRMTNIPLSPSPGSPAVTSVSLLVHIESNSSNALVEHRAQHEPTVDDADQAICGQAEERLSQLAATTGADHHRNRDDRQVDQIDEQEQRTDEDGKRWNQ